MNFISPQIEAYADAATGPEPEVLARLNRETHLKTNAPRMLSGHIQGRLLSMLSKLVAPKCIVEIGTFTGYSAICLAEGLQPGGKLITFDINDETEALAKKYFDASGMSEKIEMRIGDARKLLHEIKSPVDLVFVDADKENYPLYWDIMFPKLRSGGLMIADNVLWSGKVLEPEEKQDEETRSLIAYTKKALEEKNAEPLLLTVRDGLLVVRKK